VIGGAPAATSVDRRGGFGVADPYPVVLAESERARLRAGNSWAIPNSGVLSALFAEPTTGIEPANRLLTKLALAWP
jgi:hypothetical protein